MKNYPVIPKPYCKNLNRSQSREVAREIQSLSKRLLLIERMFLDHVYDLESSNVSYKDYYNHYSNLYQKEVNRIHRHKSPKHVIVDRYYFRDNYLVEDPIAKDGDGFFSWVSTQRKWFIAVFVMYSVMQVFFVIHGVVFFTIAINVILLLISINIARDYREHKSYKSLNKK